MEPSLATRIPEPSVLRSSQTHRGSKEFVTLGLHDSGTDVEISAPAEPRELGRCNVNLMPALTLERRDGSPEDNLPNTTPQDRSLAHTTRFRRREKRQI